MFKHFRKLWGRSPEAAEDATPAPSADIPGISENPWDGTQADPESDELDALYRQALAAMDAVETGCNTIAGELPAPAEGPDVVRSDRLQPVAEGSRIRENSGVGGPDGRILTNSATAGHYEPVSPQAVSGPGVTAQQVLEAALFVGGVDLTLKRLCWLLNEEFPPDAVERFIHELNERYEAEGRPYEIRFGTGGYRMHLRADFDAVRNRVFGLGPREVKLSQDALEVLSLIAYRQPIAGDRITELRGTNAAGVVRQLLRRELIALERLESDPQDVRYCTTPRFLQAFGMHTLSDLPQVDDLEFK